MGIGPIRNSLTVSLGGRFIPILLEKKPINSKNFCVERKKKKINESVHTIDEVIFREWWEMIVRARLSSR